MSQIPTIQLTRPIAAACLAETAEDRYADESRGEQSREPPTEPGAQAEPVRLRRETEQQRQELAQLLQVVNGLAAGLHTLHQETLAGHRVEIARLAVEISRRVLLCRVGKGDYEIQAIVEEALKQAPTRQNIVVRLNPEDLPRCQQCQRENPQSPFAELELTADWSVGRGECLVETPKGIVRSFIEQHLERISEALQKGE